MNAPGNTTPRILPGEGMPWRHDGGAAELAARQDAWRESPNRILAEVSGQQQVTPINGGRPLTGDKSAVGKCGHIVLLGLGYWALPASARLFYVVGWASTILGFFVIRFDSIERLPNGLPAHSAPDRDAWHPTIWSYLFWAFGAWCVFMMFATVRQQRRTADTPVSATEIQDPNNNHKENTP